MGGRFANGAGTVGTPSAHRRAATPRQSRAAAAGRSTADDSSTTTTRARRYAPPYAARATQCGKPSTRQRKRLRGDTARCGARWRHKGETTVSRARPTPSERARGAHPASRGTPVPPMTRLRVTRLWRLAWGRPAAPACVPARARPLACRLTLKAVSNRDCVAMPTARGESALPQYCKVVTRLQLLPPIPPGRSHGGRARRPLKAPPKKNGRGAGAGPRATAATRATAGICCPSSLTTTTPILPPALTSHAQHHDAGAC